MATTLFELLAKVGLDSSEYESGISRLSSGIKTFATGVGVAMTAASTAAVAVGKQALDAYADYEQLVGGVDTLFKDSSAKVQEYAANAFQTAGLSANAYMETVTSFSASLLQSLDGDTTAAADVANRAITDMSDNANKMGTDMQMIQNAYQGFAKQNYTMLDNLKLGYGGTKEEMARLLEDAGKLANTEFDMSSYADIIEAIHVIQTDMGITGTTAAEAAKTISGSTAAMKAAWQNLLVGISDDTQDFDSLIENLVNSVSTVADNVLPRIEIIFGGLGRLVEELFPKVVEQIPRVVEDGLPRLMALAATLLKTLVDGLKNNSKQLASGATEIITTFISAAADMLPDIVELGLDVLIALGEGISENIGTVTDTMTDVILRIVDLVTDPETITSLINAGIDILYALIDGIGRAIPRLQQAVPAIISGLIDTLTKNGAKITRAGTDLLVSLVNNVSGIIKGIAETLPLIIDGICDVLLSPDTLGTLADAGVTLFMAIVDNLPEIMRSLGTVVRELVTTIGEMLTDPTRRAELLEIGKEMATALLEAFPVVVESALSLIDSMFGSHIAEWYNQVTDFFMDFGSKLYQMANEDLLNEQELASKYSDMYYELNQAALAAVKSGLSAQEAFDNAKKSVLDTTEELYAFDVLSNSKDFGFTFDMDYVQGLVNRWNAPEIPSQNSAQYYEAMGRERLAQAQPLVITMQMPSGVEVGRQYIEDINTAKRADGAAY